jgi:hypothetical protein
VFDRKFVCLIVCTYDAVPHEHYNNNGIACVSNTATMMLAAKISRAATTMLQQSKNIRHQQQAAESHAPQITYIISTC